MKEEGEREGENIVDSGSRGVYRGDGGESTRKEKREDEKSYTETYGDDDDYHSHLRERPFKYMRRSYGVAEVMKERYRCTRRRRTGRMVRESVSVQRVRKGAQLRTVLWGYNGAVWLRLVLIVVAKKVKREEEKKKERGKGLKAKRAGGDAISSQVSCAGGRWSRGERGRRRPEGEKDDLRPDMICSQISCAGGLGGGNGRALRGEELGERDEKTVTNFEGKDALTLSFTSN